MTFEVRNGFEQKKTLQLQFMDDDLRNVLWNLHEELFNQICPIRSSERQKQALNSLLEMYWKYFFKKAIDRFSFAYHLQERKKDIREKYYELTWDKVYSFLEFTAKFLEGFMNDRCSSYKNNCNYFLEMENSAYRFIGSMVAPITSNIEIEAIERAIQQDEAGQHIESALILLADKENDQSRISIAQSISAVEAIARKVTGDNKATLAKLCSQYPNLCSHTLFTRALKDLYNYTSDDGGVRHSLTDESQQVNKSLAQFMLVICSGFVNLIKMESEAIE